MPKQKDLLFVGLQGLLFFGWAFDPFPLIDTAYSWIPFIGIGICGFAVLFGLLALVQLGSNLTPWPSPKTNSSLVTTGSYGWARHPIYAALIWFGFGLSIWFMSPWKLIVTLLLLFLFIKKSNFEESMLHERFEEYKIYAQKVKRFGI